jgi:hypothetical protein
MYSWGGKIETTSFDMVIFDRGTIFKKTIGPGGISGWSKLVGSAKKFHWEYCLESPRNPATSDTLSLRPAECANIHSIWCHRAAAPVDISRHRDCPPKAPALKEESGNTREWIYFFIGSVDQLWTWDCIFDGDKMKKGSSQYWEDPWTTTTARPSDRVNMLKELYHSSTPLSEMTIYNSTPEVDWSVHRERAENFCNDISYSSDETPAEDWTSEEYRTFEGDWSSEEYRTDPFDLQMYSKQEFMNHYGSTLEWDVMSPEKNLVRQMIGNMISVNYHILSNENVNHLLDKIIETFM